jgi:hypothetical protein
LTDGLKNEILGRVKEEKKVLNAIKRRKANNIRLILISNSFLRNNIEGKIEEMIGMMGKRGK